ncbi:MAG: PHP domain-containing protein [Candidatus Micrarchaeia archaeon]
MKGAYFKADLHIHTHFSKDSLSEPRAILRAAVNRGLSAVAITDHNEIKGAFSAAHIAREEEIPLQVIIGEEVMCDEGDLLVYFLKRKISPGPLGQVLKEVKRQGAVCCAAHPYDFGRHAIDLSKVPEKSLGAIGAIEVFNARVPQKSMNGRALSFAIAHGKAELAGSDAHHPSEVGAAYAEFPGITYLGAKSLISAPRKIGGSRSTPLVRFYSRYAALKKRLFPGKAQQ